MTMRQQWLVVLGIVALLGGGLAATTYFLGDEIFPVTIGSKAPPFRAVTLDATPAPRTLADYKGKVVLLNVWATYCEPCKWEMPSIEALHKRYGAKGLAVVAVSVDKPGMEDEIRKFRDQYGLTFDILYDPEGKIQQAYQTTGVPENFVIGTDGVIRKKVYAQDWSSEANVALIAQLLGETPGRETPGRAAPVPADSAAKTPVPVAAQR
jgi:cytochrome c biogenesis protein CcmG, thiol:disulfide interchange protein DsbE